MIPTHLGPTHGSHRSSRIHLSITKPLDGPEQTVDSPRVQTCPTISPNLTRTLLSPILSIQAHFRVYPKSPNLPPPCSHQSYVVPSGPFYAFVGSLFRVYPYSSQTFVLSFNCIGQYLIFILMICTVISHYIYIYIPSAYIIEPVWLSLKL